MIIDLITKKFTNGELSKDAHAVLRIFNEALEEVDLNALRRQGFCKSNPNDRRKILGLLAMLHRDDPPVATVDEDDDDLLGFSDEDEDEEDLL